MNLGAIATFIIGLAHIVCGVLVWNEPLVARVTPLSLLGHLCEPFQPFGTEHALVGVLLTAGTLAVLAPLAAQHSRARFWMLVPQQAVLILQLISINISVWNGIYPDLYKPGGGWKFILTDQIWAMGLSSTYIIIAVWLLIGKLRGGDN
jgi:hypothetical protein